MFYFDYVVPIAERKNAVGVKLETEEFRRQLVFLHRGSIVRNDLLPTDIERPIENQVVFSVGKQPDRGWITCDREAQFAATRGNEGTGIVFFELKSTSAHCRKIAITLTRNASLQKRGGNFRGRYLLTPCADAGA
jgi:hypothetical protein